MAQYRIPNPYNAHFALPANVMSEPPGRGTLTTNQRPRKSFEAPAYIPQAWNAHFAIPTYITAEPVGRGAMSTYQARRKSVSTLLPETLGSLGYDTLGLWPFDKINEAAKAIGSGVKKASVKIYKGGKWITYDLPKGVHCKLAASQIGTMGAGAIGKYYGVPPEVAMEVHTAVNKEICGQKYYPTPPKAPAPSVPFVPGAVLQSKWIVPVGIGVAGLAALYLLTRK